MIDRAMRALIVVTLAITALGGVIIFVDARTALDVGLFGYERTMVRVGIGVLMLVVAVMLLSGRSLTRLR